MNVFDLIFLCVFIGSVDCDTNYKSKKRKSRERSSREKETSFCDVDLQSHSKC